MTKAMDWLQEKIMPPLFKMASNKYLLAIRDAFTSTFAIVAIGSIFLLICYFPSPKWSEFISPYVGMLSVPNALTMGLIAVYMAFAMGYSLGAAVDLEPLVNGISVLCIFLLMVNPISDGVIHMNYLGSAGIFVAILAAAVTTALSKLFKKRGIVIKMPDAVPPIIAAAFEMLISLFVIIVIVWFIRIFIGVNIPELMGKLFAPLAYAADSPLSTMLEGFLTEVLWFAGIHGGSIIAFNGGILYPFALANLDANAAAVAAGLPMPNIITPSLAAFYQDSSVSMWAVCIMMIFLCKSAHLKQVGKLAVLPAIFGVTEPIWFGTPFVLNPYFMLPFLFVRPMNLTLTYFLMKLNIIGRQYIGLHWALPGFFGSYLSAGGDFRNTVWWLILCVINCLIYYPFVKMYDKELLKAEESGEAET
jgi:PTS system cellobiose-specific IIC component